MAARIRHVLVVLALVLAGCGDGEDCPNPGIPGEGTTPDAECRDW